MNGATPTAAPARREPAEWPGYLAAIVLALGLYAYWWMESAREWHPDLTRQPAAQPARLRYLAGPAAPWQEDVRGLWSPVLFALPTPVGFSPPAARREAHHDLAVSARPAAGEGVVLQQRAADATGAPPVFLRSLQATIAGTGTRLAASRAEPVFPTAGPTTGFVLRVQWIDGAPVLTAGGLAAADLASWLDDKPWEATAFVRFDEQGTVRSALLEAPTPSRERNEAIVRALRRLRAAPAGGPVLARVVLRYEQAGLPAPAEAPR